MYGDDDIRLIHKVLRHEGFEDDDCCTLWDYPLDEIGEIVENEIDVVLVECCYFDDNDVLQKEYRWFEVPEECVYKFTEEDADYTPSAENGDYSPSNPWDAPGMRISDFI
jgi:hypothetical protein